MEDSFLKNYLNGYGQKNVKLAEFQNIYFALKKPRAKIVKLEGIIFISLEQNPKIHFKITDEKNLKSFEFISNSIEIDANKNEHNFGKFLWFEFFQGNSGLVKLKRFLELVIPITIFNYFLFHYATPETIKNLFLALITAISIFIAIFTLFTVNSEYMERKKLKLFESGKLGYLFSVDKNVAKAGVYSIIFALIGILITPSESYISISQRFYYVFIMLNLSFIGVYITLRTIIEFYIHRPTKFLMGDLKKESLENFE